MINKNESPTGYAGYKPALLVHYAGCKPALFHVDSLNF
jgi:hypothetical protein